MKNKYQNIVNEQRLFFNTHKTRNISFRRTALLNLKKNIIKYENNLYDALQKDLNKNAKESLLAEIGQVYDELELAIKKLKKWSKTKKVKSNYATFGSKNGIVHMPRGIAFIISPFNYPVNLSLIPLISSIAAGNTTIMKFSELTPHVNKVLGSIIEDTFDEFYVSVIKDSELKSLNDIYKQNIDLLFFTGSTKTGKIIQKQCVENNIPYILELGGKSPTIIAEGVEKQHHSIERIVWGKLLNGGQTCVAPDYFMVHDSSLETFITNIKQEVEIQYPGVLINNNLPKIINETAFKRLEKMLKKYSKNIIFGGKTNKEKLLIEPTIILLDDASELTKIEEVFGPIFFVVKYSQIEDAVQLINTIDPNPLAAYIFTNNSIDIQLFVQEIDSPNIAINDVVIQISNPNLPFGGSKTSGTGSYHGKFGFEAFSIRKSVMNRKLKSNLPLMFTNKGTNFEQTKSMLKKIKAFLK